MSTQRHADAEADHEETLRKGTLIDALYRKYHRMLRRFLAGRHVHPDEAADIVQETYCRVLKSGDPDSIRHPRAFLRQVASHVLLNHQKHRHAGVEENGLDFGLVEIEAGEPSAYRQLKAEQELDVVRAALEELAPKCREVFVMNRFEGLSYSQISAELDLSVSMIEKYVSQALATLRERVAEAHAAAPPARAARPAKFP
jgi:RNA polymerase sigma factor (sigma-70 family)